MGFDAKCCLNCQVNVDYYHPEVVVMIAPLTNPSEVKSFDSLKNGLEFSPSLSTGLTGEGVSIFIITER